MSPSVLAAIAAAACFAAADWAAVARADQLFERIAKPAVIVALFAAVILAGPGISPVRWLLVVALAASLAGDWLLLPPGQFVGGLAAFLVAHLAYLGLFLLAGPRPEPATAGALAMAVVFVTVGRRIVAGAAGADLAGPVAAYLAAIGAMAVAATATGVPLAAAGAWLFVVSDAVLGWDRFVAAAPPSRRAAAIRRLAIIVPYHLAQVLLTVAVLDSLR